FRLNLETIPGADFLDVYAFFSEIFHKHHDPPEVRRYPPPASYGIALRSHRSTQVFRWCALPAWARANESDRESHSILAQCLAGQWVGRQEAETFGPF